jgi:uncharacterized protein
VFGLVHANNPDATPLSTFNTVVFGVLFGVAYVLTGELALALGLHFARDFVQGFGFGRSGDATSLGAFLVIGEPILRRGCGRDGRTRWRAGYWARWAFVLGFVLMAAWVRCRRGTARLPSSLAQSRIQAQAGEPIGREPQGDAAY